MYGYAGTILRIDLSSATVVKQPLDETLVEGFIGGRGFVAKLLFDELPRGIDPYAAENIFIAASGPLSGYLLPASGKTHFGTKSPASGGYADSNMGGHFGPALKYAGYDMLVLTGRAPVPSIVVIEDGRVEIRPADAYWGQGALAVEKNLKADLGEDFQILTIGPAGERRVRYACLSHDFGRQAGRSGVGAVLGSKQVKAIAVKGTGRLPVFDVKRAYAAGKAAFRKVAAKPGFTEWTPEGTAGITNWVNEVGVFPTRNFKTSFSDHYPAINGKAVLERLKITDMAGAWTNVHDLVSGGGTVERQPRAEIRAESARYVIDSQHTRPLFDALGVCRLQLMELGFEVENYEELFYYITGKKRSWKDLLVIAERIWNLTRVISAREIKGFGRSWDLPPLRFSTEPIPSGPNEGYYIPCDQLQQLLDWYYAARGWDANGLPTRETLVRLGLHTVADALCAEGVPIN